MKLKDVCSVLDKSFEVSTIKENWDWMITDFIKPHITQSFLQNPVGLMFENSTHIKKLFTACFPSDFVISKIIERGGQDSLLIVKHPFDWNGLKEGFLQFSNEILHKLRFNKISIYSVHMPLDKVRTDHNIKSTAVAFATKLNFDIKDSFIEDQMNPTLRVGVIINTNLYLLTHGTSSKRPIHPTVIRKKYFPIQKPVCSVSLKLPTLSLILQRSGA